MNQNKLIVDEQTLSDLGIFAKGSKPSIYNLFNKTATEGGARVMERLFREPLSSAAAITARSLVYRFFSEDEYRFPVDSDSVGTAHFYMKNDDVRTQIDTTGQSFSQRLQNAVAADPDYVFVHDGVQAVLRVFYFTNEFLNLLKHKAGIDHFASEYEKLTDIISDKAFMDLLLHAHGAKQPKLHGMVLSELDKLIRFKEREKVLSLLDMLYELDVNIAVGQVARKRGFCFSAAMEGHQPVLLYEGVYHPHVENAIANNLNLDDRQNMLFLTGANMAGKSTLMKSLGIAIYLGHLGFPVPATRFVFSVRDALYTSINLADNLQKGASHYYTEVLRVKEVAMQLAAGKKLFVIFDEMFRGTNVKDAYDATVAIAKAFAKKHDSQFIISTHIVEAGEELQKEKSGVKYQFLPTEMQGNIPVYPRILRDGISADRHGMIIIRNEQVLEILDRGLEMAALQ